MASYESIITSSKNNSVDNIYKYLDELGNQNLKKVYYTALARERYGMYKSAEDEKAIMEKAK